MDIGTFVTAEEVQKMLGIRRSTLYSWVKQGKLRPVRAGRGLLFSREEILRLLGRKNLVALWVSGGTLSEARERVGRWVRTGVKPAAVLEYIDAPTERFVRARVVSNGNGESIEYPAPGGVIFDSLANAKRSGAIAFLGGDESMWNILDVRSEQSPTGETWIVVELVRLQTTETADRERRLTEALARMQVGTLAGEIDRYKREDLYDRGSH
jgi:excisionase family DNA binding protein